MRTGVNQKSLFTLSGLYGLDNAAKERFSNLAAAHSERFDSREIRFFSAPGRTEICGNHTDHNSGKVIAAAVSLDAVCAASPNDTDIITVYSKGYEKPFIVDIRDLSVKESEKNTTNALLRGVCAGIAAAGGAVGGFDAVVESSVMVGSGLSSSAAIEVLFAKTLDSLYGNGSRDAVEIAKIAQFAENVYFGKPSGLMDQAASSVGGMVMMDFASDDPVIRKIDAGFHGSGYSLAVVSTGDSHDELTAHYAAIPNEMRAVACYFGMETLRGVDESEFYSAIPALRRAVPERAILRAMHFFDENRRVDEMTRALENADYGAFLRIITESGESSWMLLQNIFAHGTSQSLALALAVSRRLLKNDGAWRVHGGGFAGTIQAFVPNEKLGEYSKAMDGIFGEGACRALKIRSAGAAEILIK